MDVHPPHEPIHTWKDFLVHLATITIGLLIALGLEGAVEAMHHRHLLHTAEESLREELAQNVHWLEHDERQLDVTERMLQSNLRILNELKAHQPADGKLEMHWEWDAMQSAAWDTARNTGAVALMPYDRAQSYNALYLQAADVNEQASVSIRDTYDGLKQLPGGDDASGLSPAQLDTLIAAQQKTLNDLAYTRDLCDSLARMYGRYRSQL